jgi:hypothetical protein
VRRDVSAADLQTLNIYLAQRRETGEIDALVDKASQLANADKTLSKSRRWRARSRLRAPGERPMKASNLAAVPSRPLHACETKNSEFIQLRDVYKSYGENLVVMDHLDRICRPTIAW